MFDLAATATTLETDALHLVQIEIDVRAAVRYLAPLMPREEHQRFCSDKGLLIKTVLTEAFGSSAPKPFRIHTMRGPIAVVVGYARASADDLRDTLTMTAKPGMEEIYGGEMRSRTMPATWRNGAKVGIEVTFAPVVRVTKTPAVVLPAGVRGHLPRPDDEIDAMQWMRWRIDEIVGGKGNPQDLNFEPVFGAGWRDRLSAAIAAGAGLSRQPVVHRGFQDEDEAGWDGDDLASASGTHDGGVLTEMERCRLAAQAILSRDEVYVELLSRRLRANLSSEPSSPKTDRLTKAATLIPGTVRITRMMRETVWRPNKKRELRRCILPVLEVRGTVQIADGQAFDRLLRTGVGPHTAYGYGMLALGPA